MVVDQKAVQVAGSNSAFALVSHVVGVMAYWGSTVNRGVVVPRDRDAEFTATGTVDEALALLDAGRTRFRSLERNAHGRAAAEAHVRGAQLGERQGDAGPDPFSSRRRRHYHCLHVIRLLFPCR